MDVVYARGQASVADVLGDIADPPSYSSVRTLMCILEEKGHLRHRKEGVKYIYLTTRPRRVAARSAMRNLLRTFFDGSTEKAVASLLDVSDNDLTDQELDRLRAMIEKAGRIKA